MKLHLLRHPQPDVAPGLCYGASDIGVDPRRARARHAACARPACPAACPSTPAPCAAAPNSRAALRRPAARRCAPGRDGFRRLGDACLGAIARADVDAWNADLLGYRPGGAENVLDVARRVAAFRDALLRSGTREALVICHAGTIRLLLAMRAGAIARSGRAARRANAAPHRLRRAAGLEYADARLKSLIMAAFWCSRPSSRAQLNGKHEASADRRGQGVLPPQR
jgi:alpha-ribazole phosphatase